MELREFFAIFVIYKIIFWGIIIMFLFCGILFYFLQDQTYKTELTLNIARSSQLQNDEYDYDDFYRLQADERFADTIVSWMQTPFVVKKSFNNISQTHKKFDAKRLSSSQVVQVEFVTKIQKDALIIAHNLVEILNEESQKLNQKQNKDGWFVILASEPIITTNTKSLFFLITFSGFLGFFVAFWTVMIKHYMKE